MLQQRTEEEDAVRRAFIVFIQTARAITKYYDAYLYRKARLSIIKLATLKVLSLNGGVMNPSEIATHTYTERNNITALVSRMKREGLVRTERNPENRRLVNVIMTDKGREVLKWGSPIAEETGSKVMLSFDGDDSNALVEYLKILRQNALDGLETLYKPV